MSRRFFSVWLFMVLILSACAPANAAPQADAPLPVPSDTPSPAVVPLMEDTPVPPTPKPTPTPRLLESSDQLVGLWLGLGPEPIHMRFNADGTCNGALNFNKVDTVPNVECTWSLADGLLTILASVQRGVTICENPQATYQVQVINESMFELVPVVENCAGRRISLSGRFQRQP